MPKSITETFRDGTVLVTGFTGFLGKILVEKLLRSCPIRIIAVIVRSKKGITAQQRVETIYKQSLFDRLRKEEPDFMKRIKVLNGCLEDPSVGLSSIDSDWMITNVNFIFHCAATVRFNETLEFASKINIYGTENLLLFSTKLKNLKGFVHVSTAYSHYPRKEIREEYYPVPAITTHHDLHSLLNTNKLSTSSTDKRILGSWPNTYTFTKAITENFMSTNEHRLPVAIFRPSIIGCTKSEPQPGWVEGMHGLPGLVVPITCGILRVVPMSTNKITDVIPIDYTANALICVMWDTVNRFQDPDKLLEPPKIFNFVSSVESPITFSTFFNEIFLNYCETPPLTSSWYYFCIFIKNLLAVQMLRIFFHWIPALLMDLYFMIIGKNPKMLKMYAKIESFTDLVYPFASKEWKFYNRNTRELWSLLSDEDRMTFWFSFEEFDWKKYMKSYYSGIRKCILDEDHNNIKEAIVKNRRLFWIHILSIAFLIYLVLLVCWLFLKL